MRPIVDNPRLTFRGAPLSSHDREVLLDALEQALSRVRALEIQHEGATVSDYMDDDFWGVEFK